jgi:hypothetical protein
MARATSSLPVPLSPVIRMVALSGRRLLHHGENFLHRGRFADQVAQNPARSQLAFQTPGMGGQAPPVERPLHHHLQLLRLQGLLDEPERSQLVDRLERRFQVAERREDNRRRRRRQLLQLLEQPLAVEVGHVEVGDDHIGVEVLELDQRLGAIRGGFHLVPPARDYAGEGRALVDFVVDYQDSGRVVRHREACLLLRVFPSRIHRPKTASPGK